MPFIVLHDVCFNIGHVLRSYTRSGVSLVFGKCKDRPAIFKPLNKLIGCGLDSFCFLIRLRSFVFEAFIWAALVSVCLNVANLPRLRSTNNY